MGDDGRRWRASDGEWRAGAPPEGWVQGEGGRWYPPPRGSRRAGGIVLTWRSSALETAEAARGESIVLPGPSPAYRPPALVANRGPIRLHAVTRRRRRWSPAMTALAAAGLLLGTSAVVALTAREDGSRTRASTAEADPAIPASPRAEPTAPPAVDPAPAPSATTAPPRPVAEPAAPAPDVPVSGPSFAAAEPGSAAEGPPTRCGTTAAAAATVAPDGPRPGDGDGNPGCR